MRFLFGAAGQIPIQLLLSGNLSSAVSLSIQKYTYLLFILI